jgi:methylsterol monooxygenase
MYVAGAHSYTILLFEIFAVITTIGDHCGYHLPLQKSPRFHDYHHLTFTNNFGVTGWSLDGGWTGRVMAERGCK